MRVYVGTDSLPVTDNMTATHAAVRHLTCWVGGLGHKIFMDDFFSSPRPFDDLDRRNINSCGTVQPYRKDIPCDFGPKQMKLKRGDLRVRTRQGLSTLVWNDRWEVYMVTNMDPQPAQGNFCDDSNRSMKPHIVERYNQHMCYVNNSDRMDKSYSMRWWTFKWTKKLLFHLLDLKVLNSWILLSSCGATCTHQDFRLLLVRNLIEEAWKSKDRPTPRLVERSSAAATNVVRLESHYNQHWSVKSPTQLCYCVCSSHGQKKGTVYKCARSDVGLWVVPCFS